MQQKVHFIISEVFFLVFRLIVNKSMIRLWIFYSVYIYHLKYHIHYKCIVLLNV